ncbi:hypothetical protein [Rhodopirellula sp. MGV]|nr:hypothetical protein [Rhodopirellula sp. MGV]
MLTNVADDIGWNGFLEDGNLATDQARTVFRSRTGLGFTLRTQLERLAP